MASAGGIKAGRAYVEISADDSQFQRALGNVQHGQDNRDGGGWYLRGGGGDGRSVAAVGQEFRGDRLGAE